MTTNILLTIAIALMIATTFVRWRGDRAQRQINRSVQDTLGTQSRRITGAVTRIGTLETLRHGLAGTGDDPRVFRPSVDSLDRWKRHDLAMEKFRTAQAGDDQALERLRIEIDEIEIEHRDGRDDKHEPGS
jgi:hypothetical protein